MAFAVMTGNRTFKRTIQKLKNDSVAVPVIFAAIVCFSFLIPANPCVGSEPPEEEYDFTSMSFEELKNVTIITASRKPEKLTESAAAGYVITSEDIRRSAATSIPEVLRMAPGVQVSRIDTNMWAVGIRGFEYEFSNKLLVLIDGRSVYNTFFSGVLWDSLDRVLEDIDRIEVIRGPGGALWGANAVNGIINIITRKAGYETGGRYSLLGGEHESAGSIRYQDAFTDDGFYRLYAKCHAREEIMDSVTGSEAGTQADDWKGGRAGFRIDLASSPSDDISLSGEAFSYRYNKMIERLTYSPRLSTSRQKRINSSGGCLTAKWNHSFSDVSDTNLHFYAEHESLDYWTTSGKEDTANLDFQYRYKGMARNDLVFGIGCRYISDDYENSVEIRILPAERTHYLYSAFIQDKIEVARESFWLVLGSKFEHNGYTGMEVQPSARFLLAPGDLYSIWGSISRAVRTPSRVDRDWTYLDAEFDAADAPIVMEVSGNREFDSEKLVAWESGLRLQPTDGFWADAAIFYHQYADLLSARSDGMRTEENPVFHQIRAYSFENKLDCKSWGVELAASWRADRNWRLKASYMWWHTKLELRDLDPLTALD